MSYGTGCSRDRAHPDTSGRPIRRICCMCTAHYNTLRRHHRQCHKILEYPLALDMYHGQPPNCNNRIPCWYSHSGIFRLTSSRPLLGISLRHRSSNPLIRLCRSKCRSYTLSRNLNHSDQGTLDSGHSWRCRYQCQNRNPCNSHSRSSHFDSNLPHPLPWGAAMAAAAMASFERSRPNARFCSILSGGKEIYQLGQTDACLSPSARTEGLRPRRSSDTSRGCHPASRACFGARGKSVSFPLSSTTGNPPS
mmetsp:Transcript_28497/g.84986  ORF Transcript_28497/g.84986 Transcript_28497/m.84986 type:complete len:250 (-) Transcript_28497:41-790(-)